MIKEGPVWALGAMSGTSLDGVDAALLQSDGEQIFAFGESAYRPYDDTERAVLRAALGARPGEPRSKAAAQVVEQAHIALMSPMAGDLVGFHGQTLHHDPAAPLTHQAGDGQILAQALGRPVIWDFRSADMRMGGQGAPLAPFFHFACARHIGAKAPLAFLNLGGVGNLTWVDPGAPTPEDPKALLAFDTGPANAPLNDLMQLRRNLPFDRDGELARQGTVDEQALAQFLRESYFRKIPPKSLDRNDFSITLDLVRGLCDADAAATLCAMAAGAVMCAMTHCPHPPTRVLVTGGGRRNPVIMRMLAAMLKCPVDPVEAVGLDGDMLEAQAFAFLAVRVARGLTTSAPSTTGVAAAVGGGEISIPVGE